MSLLLSLRHAYENYFPTFDFKALPFKRCFYPDAFHWLHYIGLKPKTLEELMDHQAQWTGSEGVADLEKQLTPTDCVLPRVPRDMMLGYLAPRKRPLDEQLRLTDESKAKLRKRFNDVKEELMASHPRAFNANPNPIPSDWALEQAQHPIWEYDLYDDQKRALDAPPPPPPLHAREEPINLCDSPDLFCDENIEDFTVTPLSQASTCCIIEDSDDESETTDRSGSTIIFGFDKNELNIDWTTSDDDEGITVYQPIEEEELDWDEWNEEDLERRLERAYERKARLDRLLEANRQAVRNQMTVLDKMSTRTWSYKSACEKQDRLDTLRSTMVTLEAGVKTTDEEIEGLKYTLGRSID